MTSITGACTIESVSSRKDKTLKVVIGTQEASPELAARLFALIDQYTKFLFAPNITKEAVQAIEETELDTPKQTKYKKSQIMRFALKDLYKQDQKGFPDFDSFYEHHMELLIEQINNKVKQYH
jgi:hypothetical protein